MTDAVYEKKRYRHISLPAVVVWARVKGLRFVMFVSYSAVLTRKKSIPTRVGDINLTHPTDVERKNCQLELSQATASKHRSLHSVRVRVWVRVRVRVVGVRRHGQSPLKYTR